MTLQEQIKQDLKAAMKAKEEARKSALRVILGEFSRLEEKEIADDVVIRILKKLVKSEKEALAAAGSGERSPFIEVIEQYLPRQAEEAEIRAWIDANIDFGHYKSPMQAMREIMAHFGSRADGNQVKTILQSR